MKTVAFVLGTRAEAIKIIPVIAALERRKLAYQVFSTGQHDLSEFRFKNFTQLETPRGKTGAFNSVLGGVLFALKNCLALVPHLRGAVVVVQGDTMSTAAGALAGRLAGCSVCHVESGLRTGDFLQPFPEEASRIIADWLSQVHFAPTVKAARNTPAATTFVVGNTVVDAVRARRLRVSNGKFVIVSIHRQENIRNEGVMRALAAQVEEIALRYPVLFILPANTRRQLEKFGLLERVLACCKVSSVLPYPAFLAKLASCRAVLSDSGGLAEECSFLGKPLLIFREKTERMEAVEGGNAVLGVGARLLPFLQRFKPRNRLVFGDGTAGEKIARVLVEKFS